MAGSFCSFLIFAAILIALLIKVRLWKASMDSGPPSLPSLPIIGSILSLQSDRPPHVLLQGLQQKYGEIYSLRMGSHKVVVVNSHRHAKEVLLKKGKTFAGRPRTVTADILTRHRKDIAFADYSATWRFHRKMVHGALCMFGDGSAAIEQIICREADSMCRTLQELQSTAVDLAPELSRAVTNVICSLCFNSSYSRGDPEFQDMLRYNQGIVDTVAKDSLVDIFPWLQIFPNKDLKILRQCVTIRDKLLQKKYDEHKAEYSDGKQQDLVDALIRAKRSAENSNTSQTQTVGLTDDHLLMTVGDIFGAGVETTTTVLKWTVVFLIHHPEVQRKIQEEIDCKIGMNRHPKLSDRGNLTYLEATIREVLRIRPVTPLIPHVALADSSIGEYRVAKGARVIVNLWTLHHDKKEWRNPEIFDPGRFLEKGGSSLCCPTESYLPFGGGIRCVSGVSG
ncbi:hypothetical protein GJAV_G00238810 [Gymnothorax javanicus]|nr:hypothetical protein GJAV_G00238810 [Gymnothorax javanicus]